MKQRIEHVFIISFDQGAPAGIATSNMPLFKEMAAQGAHTWEPYTIVPSITLPSHTSMLTGVGIQKHHAGIRTTWNAVDITSDRRSQQHQAVATSLSRATPTSAPFSSQ